MVFFDPSSRARVILEVSIVTIGSDTSLGRGARAGLDGVNAQLRAREEDKRNHSVVQRLLNEAGNSTIFTPIVMSACGAMGPSMVVFLKEVYGRAKEADKFLMSQQPAPEVLVEHDDSFVVLGHALELEHSVRGHVCRVPEPHHPP